MKKLLFVILILTISWLKSFGGGSILPEKREGYTIAEAKVFAKGDSRLSESFRINMLGMVNDSLKASGEELVLTENNIDWLLDQVIFRSVVLMPGYINSKGDGDHVEFFPDFTYKFGIICEVGIFVYGKCHVILFKRICLNLLHVAWNELGSKGIVEPIGGSGDTTIVNIYNYNNFVSHDTTIVIVNNITPVSAHDSISPNSVPIKALERDTVINNYFTSNNYYYTSVVKKEEKRDSLIDLHLPPQKPEPVIKNGKVRIGPFVIGGLGLAAIGTYFGIKAWNHFHQPIPIPIIPDPGHGKDPGGSDAKTNTDGQGKDPDGSGN